VSAAHAVIVVRLEDVAGRVRNGEQVVDEVDGMKPQVVADPRGLGDARPSVVGLAQERAEADRTGWRRGHGSLPVEHDDTARST